MGFYEKKIWDSQSQKIPKLKKYEKNKKKLLKIEIIQKVRGFFGDFGRGKTKNPIKFGGFWFKYLPIPGILDFSGFCSEKSKCWELEIFWDFSEAKL